MPSKIEKKQAAAKLRKPPRDFSYTQNRELSWLRFDNRVLDEAFDETVPLFERLKFVSIFESNLDEFLMVRVGGLSDLAELKKQPVDNKSNMTASEQVEAVMAELPGLLTRWESIFKSIEGKLDTLGVHRARVDSLTPEERTFVTRYFQAYVSPVISPLVIDPRHPFPNLRNGALYLACGLDSVTDEESLLGLIEIPASMNRVVEIPSPTGTYSYILLEDVILACLDSCFGSYKPARPRAHPRHPQRRHRSRDGRGRRGGRGLPPAYEAHPQEAPAPAAGSARRLGLTRKSNAQDYPQGARALASLGIYLRYPAQPGLCLRH